MNNDLISRNALKEALQSEQNNMQPLSDTNYYIGVKQGLKLAEAIIDNAPTVEYPFYAEAYQTGYEEGKNERPQGKWIVDEDNNLLNFMKCSNCGEVAEWLDGGSQFLSKFCSNCGASMKGGAV